MARRSGVPRRRSAEERRDLVIEAAREEFAAFGLYGATGEAISYRAGISHPYLLRLFGSKRDLFLAVVDRFFDELVAAAGEAAGKGTASPSVPALERALRTVLGKREGYLCLLQFCAACGDDDVRGPVRRRFAELYQYVERLVDGSPDEVRVLFADLMLSAAAAGLQLPEVARREPWARRLLGPA
jgi:AcrR family transcriptional regulator